MPRGQLQVPFNIAFDFDGTLFENAFPNIGDLLLDTYGAIKTLYDRGFTITIWTCRQDTESTNALTKALDMLDLHKIPYDYVNENSPEVIEHFGYDPRKLTADLFVDDRATGGVPEGHRIYDEAYTRYQVKLQNSQIKEHLNIKQY